MLRLYDMMLKNPKDFVSAARARRLTRGFTPKNATDSASAGAGAPADARYTV